MTESMGEDEFYQAEKQWSLDDDRLIQLHLELHTLGLREELISRAILSDLGMRAGYKLTQLISKIPAPKDEPKALEFGVAGKFDKVDYEAEMLLFRRKWRKWIAHRIPKKLRAINGEIERLEKKLRTDSSSPLLYEDLLCQRELKLIIENYCLIEFGRIPPEKGETKGIRRKEKYPHLDPHKAQTFPKLAKRLIKTGQVDLASVYPSGKEPNDPDEAKHILEAFLHVVFHHDLHKKKKYSVVHKEQRIEGSEEFKTVLSYEPKKV